MVEYAYDIMDRITNIVWKTIGGISLGGFEYEYDAVGHIVSRRHSLGDPSCPSQMSQSSQKSYAYNDLDRFASDDDVTYTYDAAGRRIIASKTGTAFTQDDSVAYNYNIRSELTNAVAAVDSDYRYDAYDFDDIGNRETSSERGTNSVYAANQLNQYTEISSSALSASSRENFTPQFDDDGNSILPDGTIPAGSWKSHVSQRGTFFGYSGLVNWISQFWLEESINEE